MHERAAYRAPSSPRPIEAPGIEEARAPSTASPYPAQPEAADVEAAVELALDSSSWLGGRRARRILSSIQQDVDAGGTARVRQVLAGPQALYRIEVERPDMSYVRTTLMGREALTTLLEEMPEDVLRERFVFRPAP